MFCILRKHFRIVIVCKGVINHSTASKIIKILIKLGANGYNSPRRKLIIKFSTKLAGLFFFFFFFFESKKSSWNYGGGGRVPCNIWRGRTSLQLWGENTLSSNYYYLPPRLSPTWNFHQNTLSSFRGKTKHPFLNRFFINVAVLH